MLVLLGRMLACLLLAAPWRAHAAPAPLPQVQVLSYHDIRDDVAGAEDADPYAIDSQHFAAHLEWLDAHGFHPISLSQLIDASAGIATLPERPVLLTFDDGLRSTYTRAFPLLRAYGFPALVAVVTDWVDLPAERHIDYGPRAFGREDFLTWAQLREMRDSGLVEIASHTHDLHHGVRANPQGNSTPAAVTRVYDPATHRYEDTTRYERRIHDDLARSRDLIARHTGRAPRAVVWPYAAYSRSINRIAETLGMRVSFDLEGARTTVGADLHGLARLLVTRNPGLTELVPELYAEPPAQNLRALQIDLDAVYDADPAQQERNLGRLLERVRAIAPHYVFLQAFADPDGNGSADALYFPNRFLPMRADLYNRVAWQLRTRTGVEVFGWLPVLGFEPPDPGVRQALAIHTTEAGAVFRLDFTRPEAQRLIRGIYEDLAANSYLHGLLFHDDAYLRDHELPQLFPGQPAARTQALIDFTLSLRDAAERWRPKLKTVANLYALPVLAPRSQAWFAQDLAAFNRAYDHSALMAMPWMERAPRPRRWMDALVEAVKRHDPTLHKTLFELQTFDWNTGRPIPEATLAEQMLRLQSQGVRHMAWYPYDFNGDHPSLPVARALMSSDAFPYEER
ncbi:poly-beta-1,6-N-acetyl-D-glucosamine N-deacetylase PgaB [Stenotrophomonas sp. HITSZ_GD]|uniref:poly-beta-1,6-N-acetyl-D-glucosamine N-deacetylase PgaB n=1 Tax=Stenotrophomonas sp. HITSZ_GD TaxID=3037248 RepID=UPI00240DFE62|nr:poly-beta-1,6-N-acetyl-D-glucosamine N-deacetylase PgaB [Stenotrophomonas sp. HITSZ_GD]MDG2526458.1 poly-beta-1,6-N-acetyl-D-glucosamine N-deacetylase PgaB [Stenotrophomonas sp. HITSZ_GD]